MKTSEFLRKLADLISAIEGNDDAEQTTEPDNKMVPPLQQKIELLKKAVGVESIYTPDENKPDEHDSDANANALVGDGDNSHTNSEQKAQTDSTELDDIKRNAGLTVAMFDDDSDLLG